MPSKPKSSSARVGAVAVNEQSQRRQLDKGTIKIFIKFLTMDPGFYQHKRLHINPNDNLFGDEYHIRSILGCGLTSIVYRLLNNE